MSSQWTGEIIGKMHIHRITQRQLAEHLGYSFEYVCKVLNGRREPKGAEEKFRRAVDEMIRHEREKR